MSTKTKKTNVHYDTAAQLKPGRHFCNCQARIHELIRNCINCGRITCAQEGSGPCFYCGMLVVTKDEREILDSGNKKSYELLRQLMGETNKATNSKENSFALLSDSLNRAVEYKEKLLVADKNRAHSKVSDLESDYYNLENNAFLSPEDREAIIKRKEELRQINLQNKRKVFVDFDLTNKTLKENQNKSVENVNDPIIQSILANSKQYSNITSKENELPEEAEFIKDFYCADFSIIGNENKVLKKVPITKKPAMYCVALPQPISSMLADGFPNGEFTGWNEGYVLIFRELEPLEYAVPHYSPSEFYEMSKKEVSMLYKTLFTNGIFDSLDINLL